MSTNSTQMCESEQTCRILLLLLLQDGPRAGQLVETVQGADRVVTGLTVLKSFLEMFCLWAFLMYCNFSSGIFRGLSSTSQF